ncbi:MAG: sigma-70 family RNA polymerase sigma factor [Rhodothermales bacterium]|nr:sigma-70 family RNA polymerase sigma factor [Rhodothermales bacterium]
MSGELTRMLARARNGDEDAFDAIVPYVYDELTLIARRHLRRERSGHTLNTTALVHEAYLKLVDRVNIDWRDRAQFRAVAAQAMRRILVDYARRRNAKKRGGKNKPLTLDEQTIAVEAQAEMLVMLDQAMTRLAAVSPRLCRVVEYRFFGGLADDEISALLEVSERTVRRDWVKARAWLFKELYPEHG